MKLPNVRHLFRPDPGMVLLDCDLSGADAQVVAWEADDRDLKQAFRSGIDVHRFNLEQMDGPITDNSYKTRRDEYKRAVHGTNYGASARTIAAALGWTVAKAEDFQSRWFALHPAIQRWHQRVEYDLQTTRCVRNVFGYKRTYFDRPDGLLPQALAWTPQSTVALIASKAAVSLYKSVPWAELLIQVHDSLVFQIPSNRFTPSGLATLKTILEVVVPYDDPLIIPWGLTASNKSWGECVRISWLGEVIS